MSAAAHQALLANLGPIAAQRFQGEMGQIFAQYLAAADLLGRLHVVQAAEQKTGKQIRLNTLMREAIPGMTFATDLGFESLPFVRAIERIRKLTGMTKAAYQGLAERYRMAAFTIAGVSDVRLIEKIQGELINVLESGAPSGDFRKAVNALTDQAGIDRLAQFQIDTVFQTNVQTAYQNGRFEQMKDPAVAIALPYWQYATVGDGRVRPAHAALDGFVARNDDPVWRRIYPPSGYNCRCSAIAILADEAPDDADVPGLTRIPPAAASVPDPGFGGLAA
jgi:SPP1 gp7 family putative phage head morphogenesis protein